jgi:hypothetical protein
MRRGNQPEIHRNSAGHLVAVNLSADYTAEHEGGIAELERSFGLRSQAAPGLPRRLITQCPKGLFLDLPHLTLGFDRSAAWRGDNEFDDSEIRLWKDTLIAAAWSEGDFALRLAKVAKSRQPETDLADLMAAFERLDIAFLWGNVGGNPFARAGLVIAIASRLDSAHVENMREVDTDHDQLRAAAAATGIEARLRTAAHWGSRDYDRRLGFYALSPRWKDDSKAEVVFWLNPSDQENNNYGYFSVADLEAWMAGAGPIPKGSGLTCVECHQPIDHKLNRSKADFALGTCVECGIWRRLVTIRRENRSVRVEGVHYTLDFPKDVYTVPMLPRGHGAVDDKRFTIRFTDRARRTRTEQTVVTSQLYTQGPIPAHFRDRLPDNADFLERKNLPKGTSDAERRALHAGKRAIN